MFKITFRGQNSEPVTVPYARGVKIKEDWINGTLPEKIEIDDNAYESKTIKSIEKINERDSEKQRDQMQDHQRKIDIAYKEYRRRILDKPAGERALNMNIPRLIWHAHTGSHEIPEDVEQEIYEAQKEFFEDEGARRIYANPMCYKNIILKHSTKIKRGAEIFDTSDLTMRLVENMLYQDKKESL